jgi:hypothetical protein
VLLIYVGLVDWFELCGGLEKLGVIPRPMFPRGDVLVVRGGIHERSTKQFICEEAFRVKDLRCVVSFSGGVFDGGGSWGRVMASMCRGLQGLYCNFIILGSFLHCIETAGASGAFWLGMRVLYRACFN